MLRRSLGQRLWRAGADLVLPVRCLGCDRRAEAWCWGCRTSALDLHVRVHPCGLRTVAAASYDADVRDAILGYKERARRDLARPLGWLLQAAVAAAATDLRDVVLVPMPSTAQAVRRRGGDHLLRLARLLPGDAPVAVALGARAAVDSAELSAAGRRVARRQGMYARRGIEQLLAGHDVVLVDDIVTSGSTLETAHALIAASGARTVRGAVIAQTPKQVSGPKA